MARKPVAIALCSNCQRDPHTMNNSRSECSHVDCRYRHLARSSAETYPTPTGDDADPLDALFDSLED